MKRSDFHFDLPPELIARYPLPERSASRLLHVDPARQSIEGGEFSDLVGLLRPGDLLVFNNTRVIPARLWGRKETGGKLEVLIERVLGSHDVLAHVRCSKSPRPGTRILLQSDQHSEAVEAVIEVTGRQDALFCLRSAGEESMLELLQRIGHMPLPPYIDRADEEMDRERYQTVYAEREGAVAAPTAGLHFTESLIEACRGRGVETATLTLHVGAGTFQPVRTDNVEDHVMHSEYLEVSHELVEQVQRVRAAGGRVVAVGTTCVRALETAAQSGQLEAFSGDSQIFIYPGYRFRVVDAMVTNFHLPESTLLMLVSAFCGRDLIMDAYRQAIEQRYRFFSYGDALFLERADIEDA